MHVFLQARVSFLHNEMCACITPDTPKILLKKGGYTQHDIMHAAECDENRIGSCPKLLQKGLACLLRHPKNQQGKGAITYAPLADLTPGYASRATEGLSKISAAAPINCSCHSCLPTVG